MLRSSLFCILLLCACGTVAAREIQLQGANGEEGVCPSAEAQVQDDSKAVAIRSATAAKRAKPATVRSGDSSRTQGPRWHSFLPGMFR